MSGQSAVWLASRLLQQDSRNFIGLRMPIGCRYMLRHLSFSDGIHRSSADWAKHVSDPFGYNLLTILVRVQPPSLHLQLFGDLCRTSSICSDTRANFSLP